MRQKISLEKPHDALINFMDDLPEDIKHHIFFFLGEKDIFEIMSELSKSWNIFSRKILENQIKNLSQENFSQKFAYSVFCNNVKQFNLFKKMIDNKETVLKPEFFWMYQDNEKNEGIEKYDGSEECFGMSMLYAAIEENKNPLMARYLIQKMKEMEKNPEYDYLIKTTTYGAKGLRAERKTKIISTWADKWPNLGYAPDSHQATPLTMAVLKINEYKHCYHKKKNYDFKALSKLLISHGATIENHEYYYAIFENDYNWSGNSLLPNALAMEATLIKEIHQEMLENKNQELASLRASLQEKNNALLEAQQEIEELKSEIESLKSPEKKRPRSEEIQGNNESPFKKAKRITDFFNPTKSHIPTNTVPENKKESSNLSYNR